MDTKLFTSAGTVVVDVIFVELYLEMILNLCIVGTQCFLIEASRSNQIITA